MVQHRGLRHQLALIRRPAAVAAAGSQDDPALLQQIVADAEAFGEVVAAESVFLACAFVGRGNRKAWPCVRLRGW